MSIIDAIRTLCRPPYGANIASAGLFLGVYIAPRIEKLVIVKNDQQYAVSQWLQSEIFKNKFINISAISNADLMSISEASSEWDNLLDEWEQCSNYLARVSCLERSISLKTKQPIPPLLVYREERLREQATTAMENLRSVDDKQEEALSKIVNGFSRREVALLAWGVGDIKTLSDKMVSEKPLWTDSQIEALQPHIERGRQAIVQFFAEWLDNQVPKSDAPADVGDFKHKMIRVIGPNIKKLELNTEHEELETYTLQIVKKSEQIAEAHQLIRDVQSWINSNGDAVRIGRVYELRALKKSGSEFLQKLQRMEQRIQLSTIAQAKAQLSEPLAKLKSSEDLIMKRATDLWNKSISSEGDIDRLLSEVESLVNSFENLPTDQEDLHVMRKALRIYRSYYPRLSDESLSWSKFRQLSEELKSEGSDALQDEEIPWSPDDVIDTFADIISKEREAKSHSWFIRFSDDVTNLDTMPAHEVNTLDKRVKTPPNYVTDEHLAQLTSITEAITSRLNDLSVEWLLEKFKELSTHARSNFLCLANEVING